MVQESRTLPQWAPRAGEHEHDQLNWPKPQLEPMKRPGVTDEELIQLMFQITCELSCEASTDAVWHYFQGPRLGYPDRWPLPLWWAFLPNRWPAMPSLMATSPVSVSVGVVDNFTPAAWSWLVIVRGWLCSFQRKLQMLR